MAERIAKPRLYLDTTVPSAYFDERAPDRLRLTREFWRDRLPAFAAAVSSVTLREIGDTPDASRRTQMEQLVEGIPVLPITEESLALADDYMARGIFPEKHEADANHVAIAVVHGVQYLASWNFRHLVKVATRREISLANALNGYEHIEIAAPPEL